MNIRPSDGRWIDFRNACRNVPPAWTEMSYSYSVCCDVSTHTGIERCVMYRSSFRTFPSFLNPRAHSAHSTWTTLWSFRGFSSKTQPSFIISTITEQWKFSYRFFYIYPKWNILFECITINFDFTVHSQFKNLCSKSHKIVYVFQKDLSQKKKTESV